MPFVTRYSLVIALLLGTLTVSSDAKPKADIKQKITDAARRSSLDPRLVEAIVKVESNFKASATSPRGAKGLMQTMDSFEAECEIHNAYHPLSNLMGACECLRKLINRYQGNLELALAAYNAGPTAVARHKGVPPFPETQLYIKKVLGLYKELRARG